MQANMKQVRFCKKIKVRRVQSCKDITSEEMQAAWYRRQDYERARSQTKELAIHLSGECHVDVLRSIGLEPSEMKRQKHVTMRNCQLAVLLEQEQQWNGGRGFIHPRALARISSNFTKASVDEAIRRGAIVQQQVRDDERKRPLCIRRTASDTEIKEKGTSAPATRHSSSDTSKLVQTASAMSPHRNSPRSLSRLASSFHGWRQLSVAPARL
jgi:hypothetical protein